MQFITLLLLRKKIKNVYIVSIIIDFIFNLYLTFLFINGRYLVSDGDQNKNETKHNKQSRNLDNILNEVIFIRKLAAT